MQISGINGMNNISSIYTYGNSHFNQIQNNPVTPVTRLKAHSLLMADRTSQNMLLFMEMIRQVRHMTLKKQMKSSQNMQMHRMSHIIIQTIHMRFQRWKETA